MTAPSAAGAVERGLRGPGLNLEEGETGQGVGGRAAGDGDGNEEFR